MSHAMSRILNLGFHGIGAPRNRVFGEGERDFWATRELLEATLDAVADRADVALSFDDGNTTDIEIALPALSKRGVRATFFIVPGWLGTPGFIGAGDVRTLARAGMTIGNHGLAHHRWTTLAKGELADEIASAHSRLEQLAGGRIPTVAIPFGDYDDAVLAELRDNHAYDHVFTSDGGTADTEAWLQPREHVRASHTPTDLELLLAL